MKCELLQNRSTFEKVYNVLKDLFDNNQEFRKGLQKIATTENPGFLGFHMHERMNDAFRRIREGKIDNKVYEAFNIALVDHRPPMQALTDKFYDSLSSKGYNAIKDINDAKYSGYETINPMIIFNAKGKLGLEGATQLTKDAINKSYNMSTAMIVGSEFAKLGAYIAGPILGSKVIKSQARKSKETNMVKDYRKEHPESKLSNTEIIRMLERKDDI